MAILFEDFIKGFCQHERQEFKVNYRERPISWVADGSEENQLPMTPQMEADVILDVH